MTSSVAGRIASLVKLPITLLVGISTLTGYLLNLPPEPSKLYWQTAGLCALGVFLLAAAASVLNNIQDRQEDRKLSRTAGRPLPAGEVTPAAAWTMTLLGAAFGSGLLYLAGGPVPLALGILALALYNGVYTPLKRRSLWGVIAGAACGALPAAIGWCASRGPGPAAAMQLYQLALMTGIVFLWQIPHSWLLTLQYARDYSNAPSLRLFQLFAPAQIKRVILAWSSGFALLQMALPLAEIGTHPLLALVLLLNSSMLMTRLAVLLLYNKPESMRAAFVTINCSFCCTLAVILIDRVGQLIG